MHILGCAHYNQGSATRDIAHGRAVAIEFGKRLVDDGCIMLQEQVGGTVRSAHRPAALCRRRI